MKYNLFTTVVSMKLFSLVITLLLLFSCKEDAVITYKITGKQLNINDSITADSTITAFTTPYTTHLNETLDSTLAYAPETLSKSNGVLNTAIGNLMADAIFEQSNPIFEKQTGKTIDFVLLNYGGIRSSLSKGNVTARTAYKLMPFENKIVVLELTSEKVEALLQYLIKGKRPHPISSHLHITLNADGTLENVTVNQKPLEKNSTYYVATSDYLMNGGNKMYFFSDPVSATTTDYLIRKALIDYFSSIDTITAAIDNRFIQID